jgi:hypothetical protein
MIRIYDQVERGEFQRCGELRLQMDGYGLTPKGRQDRRWKPPMGAADASHARGATVARSSVRERFEVTDGAYAHLRVVDESEPGKSAP